MALNLNVTEVRTSKYAKDLRWAVHYGPVDARKDATGLPHVSAHTVWQPLTRNSERKSPQLVFRY